MWANNAIIMVLKYNSRGEQVKLFQSLLGVPIDGIFGIETEAKVKQYQRNNGLDVDGVVGNATLAKLAGVQYKPISVHITKSPNRCVKYIVIHYTAGASSKSGAAMANRNVFLKRAASADFCVDDENIIQVNPDLDNYYTWAVGDGKGKYGITNGNSISIEICSNLMNGASAAVPNHKGWYFTDASLANAIKVVRYLMIRYNLPIERVVRHYDASRKLCPAIVGWNDGYLACIDGKPMPTRNNSNVWREFKKSISV